MNTLTPEQLADLLSKIADHGKKQARAFLNGDSSIAGAAGTECLEFYDRWREESFPDAPMGEVVDSKQWDLVYDSFISGFLSGCVEKALK
jgi:hypothetical protein